MKFFVSIEKALKNGLYLDYFFKNFILYVYKSNLGNNLFYFLDKYVVEKIFFFIKYFFSTSYYLLNNLKSLSFFQILQLTLLVFLQILLVILL